MPSVAAFPKREAAFSYCGTSSGFGCRSGATAYFRQLLRACKNVTPVHIWTGVGEAVLFAATYDCDWAALISSLACLVAFLLSALPFTLGSSC